MGVAVGDTVVVLAQPYALAAKARNIESFRWMRHTFTVLSLRDNRARIESEDSSVTKSVPVDCLKALPDKELDKDQSPRSCFIPFNVGDLVTGLGCRYKVTEVRLDPMGQHTYKLAPHRHRRMADGGLAQDFYWHKEEWSHSLLEKITEENHVSQVS